MIQEMVPGRRAKSTASLVEDIYKKEEQVKDGGLTLFPQ